MAAEDHDFISDESSFYGDEDSKDRFEILVQTIESSHRNVTNMPSLTAIALKNLEAEANSQAHGDKRYNPHEGETNAWQLNESCDAFVRRIPPSTTSQNEYGPWLWCANPYRGKLDTRADVINFTREAEIVLDEFLKTKVSIEKAMEGKSAAAITKKVAHSRKEAEGKTLRIAKEYGVTTGKWMLFPMPEQVDEHWRAVVEGTVVGDLGVSAKVATDGNTGDRVPRLICVYTKDFADKEDVKRVLKSLQMKIRLTDIYYKCDAYTHLNISSGNQWGFRASLYSSKEMFKKKDKA